jgi:protein gp37
MGQNSKIEWTEVTWNPTVGCSKISPGCQNCYAETMARRLQAMGANGYSNGFKLTLLPERLSDPLQRKKPTTYFVNSMSDLFHEKIPHVYIRQVFDVMKKTPYHTYQVLTKRAHKLAAFLQSYQAPTNVWLGVTVENKAHGVPRINILRTEKAHVRFLSIEPLLEDLGKLDLSGIHWIIVGGESGPKARPMRLDWVLNIKRQCEEQNVAFFFKQWGGWGEDGVKRDKKSNGRLLLGRTWDEVPHDKGDLQQLIDAYA